MEVPGGLGNKKYVCLFEMIGTAFYVIAFNWGKEPQIIALTFTAMTILFGKVSGGHFNPAVSVAMLIKEKLDVKPKFFFFLLIVFC